MLGKVLVPLDGSRLAESVLEPLARLVPPEAIFELTRVYSPDDIEAAEGPAVEAAMQAQLEGLRRRLAPREVRWRLVRGGDPAERIVSLAEGGYGLVAMATHGRSGIERWIRGSVAERVLRACPAPLFLCGPHVPPGQGPFRRILVPLDGSPTADQVLPLVLELARGAATRVTLLRVEPLTLTEVSAPFVETSLWDRKAVLASLTPQRDRLARAGVDVEVEAEYGVVAHMILSASESHDLLAMATHGRSGLSRWWFGSVAEHVLRHVRRPLLLVRARAEGGPS